MMLRVDRKRQPPPVRWDPTFYRHARRRYDRGDLTPFITMMQEAARDAFISGCLVGRRAGYKQTFNLQAPAGVDLDEDRLARLRHDLGQLKIYRLLDALHESEQVGFKVVDFEWALEGGLQVPISFAAHGQHHFAYDEDGELRLRRGGELVPIEEEGVFVITAETAAREPYMYAIVREYILADFGIEAWASFLENFGEGIIIGKYPPSASEGMRREIDEAVEQIASASRGTMPMGSEIDIVEANRRTGDHQEFRREAKEAASIAILGHANAVQQSTGAQIGENTTALEVRREIAVEDMRDLEPWVQLLIDEYWRRNYGDGPAPAFELDKARPIEGRERLDRLDTAYRHGVRLHIANYQALGLRVDETQEWVERPANPFLD